MSSIDDRADSLLKQICDHYSPLRVTVGRDVDTRNFVIVGRAPDDDGCRLVVWVHEVSPDEFNYTLEFRQAFGRHPSDQTIRSISEAEMLDALDSFLARRAAAAA